MFVGWKNYSKQCGARKAMQGGGPAWRWIFINTTTRKKRIRGTEKTVQQKTLRRPFISSFDLGNFHGIGPVSRYEEDEAR